MENITRHVQQIEREDRNGKRARSEENIDDQQESKKYSPRNNSSTKSRENPLSRERTEKNTERHTPQVAIKKDSKDNNLNSSHQSS